MTIDAQLRAATLAAAELQSRGCTIISIDIDSRDREAEILIADCGAELDDAPAQAQEISARATARCVRLHGCKVKWFVRHAQTLDSAVEARIADLMADAAIDRHA